MVKAGVIATKEISLRFRSRDFVFVLLKFCYAQSKAIHTFLIKTVFYSLDMSFLIVLEFLKNIIFSSRIIWFSFKSFIKNFKVSFNLINFFDRGLTKSLNTVCLNTLFQRPIFPLL